jgi:MoxR-like ATPase
MIKSNRLDLYLGDGSTIAQRGLELPLFDKVNELDDPAYYLAERGLSDAVNVALALGQPLFVTGEAGTGKTQLASSIAYELGLPAPLAFYAKTTSTAKDLFYRYDALRHFHDAQFRKEELNVESYIEFQALGLAILLSLSPEEANSFLPEPLRNIGPVRSVVLIDEIDKAPRDLPNDILNEIEGLSFIVKESGRSFSANHGYKPIIVLTSNSEKNLPDAFLRRCVFYHISFPDDKRLRDIIQRRLKLNPTFTSLMLDNAIRHFIGIRELPLKKRPATAELLSWIQIVEERKIDLGNLSNPEHIENLLSSYSVLAKTQEDLVTLRRHVTESQNAR